MAGEAAEGTVPRRAGGTAGGRTDPGETEPGLTGPGPAPGEATRLRTFRSLSSRNYRLFAGGQLVSNTGTWMQWVAQDWLVLQLSHGNGTDLGIASGLQFLPQLLFAMWGGVIADRYPKRSILFVTQSAMGALALILGLLDLTGVVAVWQVWVLAFLLGMASVVDNPTRQAFVGEMVGPEGVANAIALNSAIFNLGRIAGPAVAGLIIGAFGTPIAFLVNAASYLAVLTGLKLMRPGDLSPPARAARTRGQLRETLRYGRELPELWVTLVVVFFVATFGMNFSVTTALMARHTFHVGASEFGLASSSLAAGALAGALVAARRARPSLRLLLATGFAFGVVEVVCGLMPVFWSFLVLLVPTGLMLLIFTTTANATAQLSVSPAIRGRVMGLYMLVFLGGTPLGAPLAGWVAELFGARMGLIGGGVIAAGGAAVAALLLARVRRRSRVAPEPALATA